MIQGQRVGVDGLWIGLFMGTSGGLGRDELMIKSRRSSELCMQREKYDIFSPNTLRA